MESSRKERRGRTTAYGGTGDDQKIPTSGLKLEREEVEMTRALRELVQIEGEQNGANHMEAQLRTTKGLPLGFRCDKNSMGELLAGCAGRALARENLSSEAPPEGGNFHHVWRSP